MLKTSSGESQQNLLQNSTESLDDVQSTVNLNDPVEKPLGPVEKSFLLHAERGDCATVRRLIKEYENNPAELDLNCVDPLNRSALIAAIENENIELIRLLLEENIKVKDGLLHAIKEEYVEAVELLLQMEEQHHVPGEPYSWEAVDRCSSTFTSDITPLILAAHKNNYEIIKILLDRGASLPMPHDVRCGCDDCVESSAADSLRHSQARINAYRALTASSLIALSSKDPLLTAFELSWELRKLSRIETEFRADYNEMRALVQTFATSLLDHARTSHELEIMLNYNTDGPIWNPGEHQTLERLKLAIKYKQKAFVAHPSVQQLLAAIWYEGLPGFRRKSLVGQMAQVAKLAGMFPVYCTIFMMAPKSTMGLFMTKPFVKFICHSSSYGFFLVLLGAASQRIEFLALELLGNDWMKEVVAEWRRKERGAGPGVAECGVILYMISLIYGEIKSLWDEGMLEYFNDLWNIVDFITNFFYVTWLAMRMSAFYIVWREANQGRDPWYPREQWHIFDPMLLSEGAFAAGMIFSFLKLVHMFSINPHMGPLQISLGRMIIDIVKFFFIYTLVLFAFGCGLNQLLWYYAELEKNKCYHLPSGLPDFENNDKACTIWRRYSNLFETSQSLFWASFGLVDLNTVELTGIKGFTRFWALLMFGSYSVINVIVLLNMLIAMMSNSYQIISERSDTEWKFARSRLWISYFEEGDELPPPFNIFPTPETFLGPCKKKEMNTHSFKKKTKEIAIERHEQIMKLLVRRYVTAEQRKRDDFGITEDDVMEIRQDISTLRYEILDVFRSNGMKTPSVNADETPLSGKKGKVMERRLLKDFHIGIVEAAVSEAVTASKEPKDIFGQIAKVIGKRASSKGSKKKDWNALVRKSTIKGDPIGSTMEADKVRFNRQSLRRHILTNVQKPIEMDQDKLLEYNPKLQEVPRGARVAYAKFMTKKIQQDYTEEDETKSASPIMKRPTSKPSVKFHADSTSAPKSSKSPAADVTKVAKASVKKADLDTKTATSDDTQCTQRKDDSNIYISGDSSKSRDVAPKRTSMKVLSTVASMKKGKDSAPTAPADAKDTTKDKVDTNKANKDLKDIPKDGNESSDKSTDKSDDKTVDKSDDKSDDKTLNKSHDKPVDKSDDKSDDKTLNKSHDKPVDKSDDKPVDKSDDKSDDKTLNKSHDKPVDKSDDKSDDKTLNKSDDKPVNKSDDKSDEKSNEKSADNESALKESTTIVATAIIESTKSADAKVDKTTKLGESEGKAEGLKPPEGKKVPPGTSKLSGKVRTGWI